MASEASARAQPQTINRGAGKPFVIKRRLHWSYAAMVEHNPAGVFIANVDDLATIAGVLTTAPGTAGPGAGSSAAAAHSPAHWIKIGASSDGTFTVTNSRNNFSKTYVKK